MIPSPSSIAVIGGTGAEGRGLAMRLALAGHRVVIGSRDAGRAALAAAELSVSLPPTVRLSGTSNVEAAQNCGTVLLTVPHAVQRETAVSLRDKLQGKILIDSTVPLRPPKVSRVQLPADGSAVASLQKLLGPSVRVVSAFQNVSAHHLQDTTQVVDCDVLVCGDDEQAREEVVQLATTIGLRGWHAGPIDNSVAAEALTSVLISINRRHGCAGAGLRITGVPLLD